MLHRIDPSTYSDFISLANNHDCGKIYPLSIAQKFQEGDIFANSTKSPCSVLFWTHTGFAYLSGKPEESFLNDVYSLMTNNHNSKRFILMTNNDAILEYFRTYESLTFEKRYFYEYRNNLKSPNTIPPNGYELKEIDNNLLTKISGTVTPDLFWKDQRDFLKKGKGFCMTYGNEVASWAFSAAISSEQIDIGIETNPNHKKQGLGYIVASKMIEYALSQNKDPVWACHYQNNASAKMAEKLGFVKSSECFIIKSNNL